MRDVSFRWLNDRAEALGFCLVGMPSKSLRLFYGRGRQPVLVKVEHGRVDGRFVEVFDEFCEEILGEPFRDGTEY